MKLHNMIIVTFTKLFVTNIVASVRSLSSRKNSILRSFEFFSGSIEFKSDGDKLKKAISDPLAKADMPKRNTAKTIANKTPDDGSIKWTSSMTSCKKLISNLTRIYIIVNEDSP